MTYYFYLARCANNALYAGYCKNPRKREEMHNAGSGAKYTRAHRPVRIIYTEAFTTQSEAMQREVAVKQWNKDKKEALALKKEFQQDEKVINTMTTTATTRPNNALSRREI